MTIIAAITAIFVAWVAYLQWRTAQQKSVLDLFDKRHAIYEIRKAVSTIASNSTEFNADREREFMQAIGDTYFFFGDDVGTYMGELWSAITEIEAADMELRDATADDNSRRAIIGKRRDAMNRVAQFHANGMPLFAKYMRFSQAVPRPIVVLDRLWPHG